MAKKKMTVKKRLPPRDKKGRFMKRAKKVRKKPVPTPVFSQKKTVKVAGGRELTQRYFIDKFKKNNKVEWEVWTVSTRGTKPLMSKGQLIKKVQSIT